MSESLSSGSRRYRSGFCMDKPLEATFVQSLVSLAHLHGFHWHLQLAVSSTGESKEFRILA